MIWPCLRRCLAPALLGLAWVHVTMWAFFGLAAATQYHVGIHALDSIFTNPWKSVWYLFRVPREWPWRLAPFYGYYTLLTVMLWNGRRGGRAFRIAVAGYVAHLAATLLLTLVCGSGVPIPRLDGYYLPGDLKALLELGRREPWPVGRFAFCLAVWHGFAVGSLVWPWLRRRPGPGGQVEPVGP